MKIILIRYEDGENMKTLWEYYIYDDQLASIKKQGSTSELGQQKQADDNNHNNTFVVLKTIHCLFCTV